MRRLRILASGLVRRLPRSQLLLDVCRVYSARFAEASGENDANMRTNGELRLLKKLAPRLKVVFDIGANTGEWTAQLLSFNPSVASVRAFEPCRAAFAALLGRGFPPSVTLHNIGLSSRRGHAEMFLSDQESSLNSLYDRSTDILGGGRAPVTRTEPVVLDTLDSFCLENGVEMIDLVKIDTEGHELDVLEGARRVLREGRVKRIQFEYGGTFIDSRRLLKDAFSLLHEHDFSLFLILPDGTRACPRYDQRLENFQYKNFIALHCSLVVDASSDEVAPS